MERPYFQANETLELADRDGIRCRFIVCGPIGRGTRSVGCRAFRLGAEELGARLLYEFCPAALQPGSAVYEREKQRFLESIALQARLGGPRRGVGAGPSAVELLEEPRTGTLFAETALGDAVPLSAAMEGRPLASVLKTMLGLLREIERYHERGFLLLALKPQNILICGASGKRRVRLLDFGGMLETEIAADPARQGEALISFSRKWSAPEVLSAERQPITEKADVFSAGAVLYSCLCGGSLPAVYSNAARSFATDFVYGKELKERSGPVAEEALCKLLSEMLASDPAERISAAEAQYKLQEIIEMTTKGRGLAGSAGGPAVQRQR